MHRTIQTPFWWLLLLFLPLGTVQAAPWVDPGEEQLRHHVQVLADAGVIRAPITTWPLSWGAIATDLELAGESRLNASEQWSLAYVKFYLQRARNRFNLYARAGAAADPVVIRDFASDQREQYEMQGQLDWTGDHLAARLALTWAPDATDGKDYRFDGSYVSGLLGNWAVTAGAIDRWWGPSWQSSLILSNNARPVPGVSLHRQGAQAFETPWLSWIGPWTLTMFAGQLESDRAVPNAKLLGARLAIKPLSSLELGFSRTAQWGGDGRPQDWDSFWNATIGNDNGDTEEVSGANDPANQLGAVDLRWNFSLLKTQSAFYLQYVGEDESGGFPSRGMDLAGLETAFSTRSVFHRFALEYADSMAGAHSGKRPNVAYEHSTYLSGYRYYGRNMAPSLDNDTRTVSLQADHYFTAGSQLSWRLAKLDINRDGLNRGGAFGGSPFQVEDTTILAEIRYSQVIKNFKVSTSVYNVDQKIQWEDETIDGTGFGVAIEYQTR